MIMIEMRNVGSEQMWVSLPILILLLCIYDRVSDVVENGGRFASKILTHNRMH